MIYFIYVKLYNCGSNLGFRPLGGSLGVVTASPPPYSAENVSAGRRMGGKAGGDALTAQTMVNMPRYKKAKRQDAICGAHNLSNAIVGLVYQRHFPCVIFL